MRIKSSHTSRCDSLQRSTETRRFMGAPPPCPWMLPERPVCRSRDSLSPVTIQNDRTAGLARPEASTNPRTFPIFSAPPPPVDQVAIEERVGALAKRSIKKGAKVAGLKLAVRMMDLTTL